MHSKMWRKLGVVGLIASVAYASVGCGAERDPINRVQPDAYKKTFFVGEDLISATDNPEFYMRNTIVDVPYGATQDGLFTASYAQPINRVKWEITQDALIGRLAYGQIENADHKGSTASKVDGQVVAAFTIEKHFDVRADYNPGTGEETNVQVENDSDRPWYQRDYIRVDWSKNLITTAYTLDTMSQLGLYGGVEWEALSLEVNDPSDPNYVVYAPEEGYFDVTVKAFAKPTQVDTPWGKFPSCFFYGVFPAGNCNPSEATLRLSFKKVVDNDFEPTEWDGKRMDAFGVFYQERQGYERNYGINDERWHRFADKYNTWKRSHISFGEGTAEVFPQCGKDFWRDATGAILKYKFDGNGVVRDGNGMPVPDANGQPLELTPIDADANRGFSSDKQTAEECSYYGKTGSRCDTLTNRCTLPMFDREIKTIPWYYGPDAPTDLFASTAAATEMWNLAVKSALQSGKKAEWDRLNSNDLDGSDGTQFPQNDLVTEEQLRSDNGKTVPHVFVLCHNPVLKGDDVACGREGLRPRLGDIRYNSINLIDTPQMGSPWGIMVDAADPLTGEKIQASVNEWVSVLDSAAQGTMDTIRWLNGEISDDDVVSGRYLNQWLGATNRGLSLLAPATPTKEQIQGAMAAASNNSAGIAGGPQLTDADMKSDTAFRGFMARRSAYVAGVTGPTIDNQLEANRLRLVDSKFEAMLVTPDQLQRVGLDRNTPVAGNSTALSQASVIRGLSPEMAHWKDKLKSTSQARNGYCMVEQEDSEGYVSLAREAQKLFPAVAKPAADADEATLQQYNTDVHNREVAIWTWLREQFHISVIGHEMGHSMSLRHNFVSNFDTLNFHPQYWQLRTNNGNEKVCEMDDYAAGGFGSFTTPHANGNDCVGPRWVDPVTEREINGNIWKWASTTVMDYPGDINGDTIGIGMYDRAAMRNIYADLVDVEPDSTMSANKDKYLSYLDRIDGFGGISGPLDFGGNTKGAQGGVGNGHYSNNNDRFGLLGTPTGEVTDASDVLSQRFSGPTLLHRKIWDMTDMCTENSDKPVPLASAPSCASYAQKNFAQDPTGKARRPYMFGSDEYADSGNQPVFRFDSGADTYEQQEYLVNNYENRYIFTHFRKKNRLFNTETVVNRMQSRYFDKMQASTKGLGLYYSLLPAGQGDLYSHIVGFLMPHALSSARSFDEFASIITRPEPGYYYYPPFVASSGCPNRSASATVDFTATPTANATRLCGIPADFVVPTGSGEGRFIHNDYDYTQGYNWSDYQMQVGSYYEKVAASYYLMEGYNHFLQNSKDDYIDGRSKNINYTTLYPQQMQKLMGYIMQDDRTGVSPYTDVKVTTAGQEIPAHITFPSWSTSNQAALAMPANTTAINPLIGWEEQYPIMINGFYYGGTTLTMDWVQQMRVITPSGTEAVSYGDDQYIRYSDPNTGILYVARDYGDDLAGGKVVNNGMGARMLGWAQQVASAAFVSAGVDANGIPQWAHNDNNQPLCLDNSNAGNKQPSVDCSTAMGQVRYYSANLDTLRELAEWMGTGPLDRR